MIKQSRVAPGASSTELADALATAQADLVAAGEAVLAAEHEYNDHLLDDTPAESRKRRDKHIDAGVLVDRCHAMIRAIEKKLAEAIEAEDRAHRAGLVDVACKKSEAARKRLEAEYPAACEKIRSLLRDLADADKAVLDANDAALEGEPDSLVRRPFCRALTSTKSP